MKIIFVSIVTIQVLTALKFRKFAEFQKNSNFTKLYCRFLVRNFLSWKGPKVLKHCVVKYIFRISL